jgi:hypothetical protein
VVSFVYDNYVGRLGDASVFTGVAEVVVVDTSYVADSSHEFVADLGASILGRDDVDITMTNTSGLIVVRFDTDPSVDLTATDVGGWVLSGTGADDDERELFVWHDQNNAVTAEDPYDISCPEGIARAYRA